MIQIEIDKGQSYIKCNGELVGFLSAFIVRGDKCHALINVTTDSKGVPCIPEAVRKTEELLEKEGVQVIYLMPSDSITLKGKEVPKEMLIEI